MHWTRSESLQKASWQESPKCPTKGSSSLHLCRVGSLGQSTSTSCSGKLCHLALGECTVVADLLGWQEEGRGSLDLVVSGEIAVRRPGRDRIPVNKWRGYISFPRASLGQAWRAAPQAHREDWWECFSTSWASSSTFCMASWCCHYSFEACTALAASTFLTLVAWITSALLVEAEWAASTFLMPVM